MKSKIIDKERNGNILSALKEAIDVPEGFLFYPVFVKVKKEDEIYYCFIEIQNGQNLNMVFSDVEGNEEEEIIENIGNYKLIYLLVSHKVKILDEKGETFLESDSSRASEFPCKEFKTDLDYPKIYVCHMRSNTTLEELKKFIEKKLKEHEKSEVCDESDEGLLTFIIADKTTKNFEVINVAKNVLFVFPDYTENFVEKIKDIAKEKGLRRVEIVSHGRLRIKEVFEKMNVEVKFFDITSTDKELYGKFRGLEELHEKKEEFLKALEEIKDHFERKISEPLILKKINHRLGGQLANLRLTKDLYVRGKESEEEVISVLKHVGENVSFIKSEIEKLKKGKCSENLEEIKKKLENVEKNLSWNWEEILENTITNLEEIRRLTDDIKNCLDNK